MLEKFPCRFRFVVLSSLLLLSIGTRASSAVAPAIASIQPDVGRQGDIDLTVSGSGIALALSQSLGIGPLGQYYLNVLRAMNICVR